MKNKMFFMPILVLLLLSSCSKEDALVIDYKMNVVSPAHETNYFNWSFAGEKVEDKYDATSQASLKGSTAKFNSVRYAGPVSEKKLTMPAALRGLFLYAIADWSLVEGDALNVSQSNGVVTVRYAHHGKAYELMTDSNGNFDVLKDAKMATNFADKSESGEYIIKDEYLIDGGDALSMRDLDYTKLNFNPDKYTSDAEHHFEGTLKFSFKDNVLSVSGKLYKK
ncbi:MAG: hypothetical protein ACTTKH_04925 [Treponema sp.]